MAQPVGPVSTMLLWGLVSCGELLEEELGLWSSGAFDCKHLATRMNEAADWLLPTYFSASVPDLDGEHVIGELWSREVRPRAEHLQAIGGARAVEVFYFATLAGAIEEYARLAPELLATEPGVLAKLRESLEEALTGAHTRTETAPALSAADDLVRAWLEIIGG